MSDVALFGIGSLVTLLVAAAVALLIFGAVLDGHENDRARAERGLDDAAIPGASRQPQPTTP